MNTKELALKVGDDLGIIWRDGDTSESGIVEQEAIEFATRLFASRDAEAVSIGVIDSNGDIYPEPPEAGTVLFTHAHAPVAVQEPPFSNFACYLLDKCEGETITEESLQNWGTKFLQTPQYANAGDQQHPKEPK